MKKRLCLGILFLGCLLIPGFTAKAANHVTDIQIEAVVNQDGSMDVTQTWTGDFTEGTENYIPMRDGGVLEISNFRVSENGKEYLTKPEWDVDADFNQKVETCGINETDDGFELCWGISSYGQHTYEISYHMSHVMGAYEDKDATNYRFINDNMNTGPTNASVRIRLADSTPLTDENCDIYAFGFQGQIAFDQGTIYAYTQSPITEDNYLTVLFALDKGLITPDRTPKETYEDMKSRAMKGSDYEDDVMSTGERILLAIFTLAIVAAVIALIVFLIMLGKETRRRKRFTKEVPYYRDIPNEGNLPGSYTIGKYMGVTEENTIIGAFLLRMVQKGYLTAEPDPTGNGKKKILRLMGMPEENIPDQAKPMEAELYHILEAAAGEDKILQEKELKRYCRRKPETLRNFLNDAVASGQAYCDEKRTGIGSLFFMKKLTEAGKKELSEAMGIRRYLKDFSLLAEREITETIIWQDYMVYAYLFGIAEEVMKELKRLYPQYIEEMDLYYGNMTTILILNHGMYDSMTKGEEARSSGSGGSSSLGGGGGSFGGGSGGGSR